MKIFLTKTFGNNWFYASTLLFVIVLPFSQALVSVSAGILLLVALIEDNWKNKQTRLKANKYLWFLPGIYVVYLLSAFVSNKLSYSLYDLQKSLFFLVIPLAFIVGKMLTDKQKQVLFFFFVFSVFISTIIALVNWRFSNYSNAFSVHEVSLISHIRFSFQLILALWFLLFIIQQNYKNLNRSLLFWLAAGTVYFLAFLFFQQSLTGILALTGSLLFYLFFSISGGQKKIRIFLAVLLLGVLLFPVLYIVHAVQEFYDIEKIAPDIIELETAQGNKYEHHFDNPMVENGKYVYLFICEPEMKEEWNKVSVIQYDSVGTNGFPVKTTLFRYLTSKGLRKDANGVKALTGDDIKNIENGLANVIYAKKKFSLYPRVYQTIWEYYVYSKTGDANMKSFSQRIEYAKAALSIIRENLWFGVGTGNWKEEFKKAYQTNNPNLSENYYASAHNQYLNYLVKFGITGFFLIFFLILYPVFKLARYNDHLFMLFLIFMFFANLADSNFESHMGSSFFVFFYCVFITGGNNYLELLWKQKQR